VCADENKRLVHFWFEEAWNQGRTEIIDQLVAPDCLIYGLGDPLRGPDPFKEFHRQYTSAFPDLKIEVHQVVAEGDWTAQRFGGVGTHTGDGLGVAATGNPVSFTAMSFTRWKDGRMIEAHNTVDFAELHRVVGLT
jgi:predicted ester cyclase